LRGRPLPSCPGCTRNAGNLHPFSIVGALERVEDTRENDSSASTKEVEVIQVTNASVSVGTTKSNEGGKVVKKIGLFLISSTLVTVSTAVLCSFTTVQAGCQQQPIAALAETVHGSGFLCSLPGDVTAGLEVGGLTPGDAYTFWFVYIPDGTTCGADQATCFGASATGGQQNAVPAEAFGRLSDVIAPEKGKAILFGDVPGLRLSKGSQVWLLLKGHGPANTTDNLARARQLLTPEDPTVGAPNLGIIGGNAADNSGLAVFNN
jgi:hypothetical protein